MLQLCSLPPMNESFEENVNQSHFQRVIWKSALDLEPPDLDRMLYGWSKDKIAKSFVPITCNHLQVLSQGREESKLKSRPGRGLEHPNLRLAWPMLYH